ncbi:MAG TPA: PIG-L family deacetylase [Glaciibacter sp.]|nr:PIG-L family deacetylase [Glaciibacter sp.]
MTVMSGSAERVVFVFERPGDEALLSGGTIARLRSEGGQVAILFSTTGGPAESREQAGARGPAGAGTKSVQAAMDELDVRDWRVLHATADGEDGGDRIEDSIAEVVDRVKATALVVGTGDIRVTDAATGIGDDAGIPVFLATRMSESHAERLKAIDIAEFADEKRRALSAYRDRWTVQDGGIALPDGTVHAVPEFEGYVEVRPSHPPVGAHRPTGAARLGSSVGALAVGVAFGVLGTIGHQSTIAVGPVSVPVGLILALGGAAALLVGLRLLVGDRVIVFFCALGMLGTIFLLSLRSTGGSVLIPAGLPGTLWSVAPTLVAALVLAWPKLPARR